MLAAGLEVWFDQSELRGGDAWDASIRAKIKDCALFMPIISANTESRSEGYFRLEWKLAVDRSHLMADDQAFLLPVVIDETPEATARVPDGFRVRQWMRLPGGAPTPEFVAQVRRLLGAESAAAARDKPDRGASATRIMATPSFPKSLVAGLGAAAFALAGLIAYHYVAKEPAAVATSASIAKPDSAPAVENPLPNSVAVLAFANLSGDKDNEYFSDGVSEELPHRSAEDSGVHVAARLSSFSFKGTNATTPEIGRKLGVQPPDRRERAQIGAKRAHHGAVEPRGQRRAALVRWLHARAERRVRDAKRARANDRRAVARAPRRHGQRVRESADP
jgi:hypothetical protein